MFLCEPDGFIRRKRHKPTLSLERFEEHFQAFLLETYHRRISVKGRLVPSERWEKVDSCRACLSRLSNSISS
jgi:hypothetical protein